MLKLFNSYWWKDFFYNQVSSRIWPCQRWLTKQIPRTWVDKDTLFELVILESIKHYVEKDHGLGFEEGDYEFSQNDPEFPEHQKTFNREVKANYDLITQVLPKLQAELKAAWAKVPHRELDDINTTTKADFDATYGEVERLEKEIHNMQTRIMLWAVANRGSIWT
jgi:hypothetical protein